MIFAGKNLFETLLENLSDGVYFVDTRRVIQYWNRAAESIAGYSRDEVLGKSCSDNILVHVDERGTQLCKTGCPLTATLADGQAHHARVYLHHKDGHRVPVHVFVNPIRDSNGNIIGGVESFLDDSGQMAILEEIEELKRLALICPLTGVGNRRYAEQVVTQRIDEMRRNNRRFSVLFIDIDKFKAVNDTFGHEMGDRVLKTVAKTLSRAMRSYDFLGRWGGEEFLAVMPNMKQEQLKPVADRLRALVKESPIATGADTIRVTVSIGACISRSEDTAASVVARADQLMYQSKRGGRDCVSVDESV